MKIKEEKVSQGMRKSKVCCESIFAELIVGDQLFSMYISTIYSLFSQLKLRWQTQKRAPYGMDRGAAAVHGNTVYCIRGWCHTVYRYCVEDDEWSIHSECPHIHTGLAIIKDALSAIGGEMKGEEPRKYSTTNKVVSWKEGRWVEEFPPMCTARWNHAVVGNDQYVIAAGGDGETSVELYSMDVDTWFTVTPLPQELHHISATLCCNHIYIMSYEGQTFSMAVPLPIANCSASADKPNETRHQWKKHPKAPPIQASTLCTISGAILTVGGAKANLDTADIHQLIAGEWVKIGHMNAGRVRPIVAVLPGDRMVVAGDFSSSFPSSRVVELAFLS